MEPISLDHVALWVDDRPALAAWFQDRFELRSIDDTNRFTLLGPDALAGKITLFDTPRQGAVPGRLIALELADNDDGQVTHISPGGLAIRTVARPDVARHSLVGVVLAAANPHAAAQQYVDAFGFTSYTREGNGSSVSLGGSRLVLLPEADEHTASEDAPPMLNHLGLLVSDAFAQERTARERGLEVLDIVDAPNTIAVFLRGPDGVRVEYVAHKPEFALA